MAGNAWKLGPTGLPRLPRLSHRFPSRCAPGVRQAFRARGATVTRTLVVTGGWQTSKEPAYVKASRARQGTDWFVSREGVRAVTLALAILAATAAIQALVFALTGSLALLADPIHNGGDALTAIPLGIAFALRSPRAERLAGLAVVATIAALRRLSSGWLRGCEGAHVDVEVRSECSTSGLREA